MHDTPPVTTASIRASIAAALDCETLDVRGDGHHFEALIVSPAFSGLARVRRHQLVYAALGDRMREEIHALSMTTLTPAEWVARASQAKQ
jgi:acid stress-induced BolA-like protein IbaG/YrbA